MNIYNRYERPKIPPRVTSGGIFGRNKNPLDMLHLFCLAVNFTSAYQLINSAGNKHLPNADAKMLAGIGCIFVCAIIIADYVTERLLQRQQKQNPSSKKHPGPKNTFRNGADYHKYN